MSSRQEEKQRRKEERLAAERAEASAAQRKRLVQIVAGVVVAAAAVVGIVLALSADGGGGGASAGDPVQDPELANVDLPPQREQDLEAAVDAAGCTFEEFENFGQEHTDETLTPADFETNPPTSGQHNPIPAEDGIYEAGNPPPLPNWVHTLEHGRIIFMYAPGTPKARVDQLRALYAEDFNNNPTGYHTVVMENNTDMPFQVAAVAWRRYVGCEKFTDATFDALRAFRTMYVDQAPELVP